MGRVHGLLALGCWKWGEEGAEVSLSGKLVTIAKPDVLESYSLVFQEQTFLRGSKVTYTCFQGALSIERGKQIINHAPYCGDTGYYIEIWGDLKFCLLSM